MNRRTSVSHREIGRLRDMDARIDLTLFRLRSITKVNKSNIALRPAPFEIYSSLDQELTKWIQEHQARIQFLHPKELPHLVNLQEDILSLRRNDQIQTGKHNSESAEQIPTSSVYMAGNLNW